MNKTIIQVPVEKSLRNKAAAASRNMGFSSLQDLIRMVLQRTAEGTMRVTFEEPPEHLSPKAIRRYNKIIDDIESGREKVKSFDNVEDFLKDLYS